MKAIERLNLLDRVGRELQSRMSYSDIQLFLKRFEVDTNRKTSPVNSKRVYVKDLLSDAPDDLIIRIADELDIAHGHAIFSNKIPEDSRFWVPGYLRVFISHLSNTQESAGRLKDALRNYAITAFVAHEDIEPTLEWQAEIEKALFSMDALVAILTPRFQESKWTDQEVGFALGRGVLVIPLRKGLDPYGFIGKIQGIQGEGKTVRQVSEFIFQALASNPATKNKMASTLVDQVVSANDIDVGIRFIGHLQKIETLPQTYFEILRDNLPNNQILAHSDKFISALNAILSERDLLLFSDAGQQVFFDDNIPF